MKKLNIKYELFMSMLAIIISIVIIFDLFGIYKIDSNLFLVVFDRMILAIFAIDYFFKLIFSKNKIDYFKNNIFELLAIIPFYSACKFFRLFKIFKILRLLRMVSFFLIFKKRFSRFLKTNNILNVTLITIFVVLTFGIIIFFVEPGINTISDALWWAFVTATTVGYGDVSPSTATGRIAAAFLMLIGIGFIGYLTSAIVTFFIDSKEKALNIDSLNSDQIEIVNDIIVFLKEKNKEI